MRDCPTLYHFTDAANLPGIRKRGLVPAPLLVFPRWQKHKGVWLTLSPDGSPCDGTTMLTVRLDAFDPRLHFDLEPDPEFQCADWRIYLGTIPPEKIIAGLKRKHYDGEAILWALAFGYRQHEIAKAWHISGARLSQILRGRRGVPGIAPKQRKWRRPTNR